MLGSGFRLYLAYEDTSTPKSVSSLVKKDGTNATGNVTGPPAITYESINQIRAHLKLADELKNVTEAGNPNTINTTTRRTARQGVQSNEITTISRDLTAQFVYEPHESFGSPKPGFEVLDLLEYLEQTKQSIFIIDLDKALNADGARAGCGNYTVALSQPREVEGQVVYDVTFAVKGFYQRVEWDNDNTVFKAITDP